MQSQSFTARLFFITNPCVPYIEPRPFMTFWASHISFLPPSYARKRYKRNPFILKFMVTFGAFQFALHNFTSSNDDKLLIHKFLLFKSNGISDKISETIRLFTKCFNHCFIRIIVNSIHSEQYQTLDKCKANTFICGIKWIFSVILS